MFKPCGDCRFIHRQIDGFVLFTATAFHPMAFSSSVVFPSGWATSGQASRLPAARPLARGGVSVMAYIPVSIVRNRLLIPEICFITCSKFPGPNRSMGRLRLMVLSISNDYLSNFHVAPQQTGRWSRGTSFLWGFYRAPEKIIAPNNWLAS
jgi:hypothetical protein